MKEISYEGPAPENKEAAERTHRSTGSGRAPTVRTFRADVEELIEEKGVTKAQVIMAEAARRESRGERRVLEEESDSHLGWIIFILLLVLAFGLGVGAYALIGTKVSLPFFPTATTTPSNQEATTEELGIVISGSPREQVFADISIAFGKTSLPLGEKRAVTFLVKDPTGATRPATVTEFLEAVLPEYPRFDIARSLDEDFVYEIRSGTTLAGALTVSSRSYANSFAAMLDREPMLASDLLPILNAWYDRKYIPELNGRPFKDEQIGTTNIRVLYDATGKAVIAYGFADKKVLVIAGNRDALERTLAELGEGK